MRFLADKNFLGVAVEILRQQSHDVVWIRTYAPGSSDIDVLAIAEAENRILLTFDRDFGELASRAGLPAICGIVLAHTGSTKDDCHACKSNRLGWTFQRSGRGPCSNAVSARSTVKNCLV
jgi:predicted nuclease of predicted toxin-antitoxin system